MSPTLPGNPNPNPNPPNPTTLTLTLTLANPNPNPPPPPRNPNPGRPPSCVCVLPPPRCRYTPALAMTTSVISRASMGANPSAPPSSPQPSGWPTRPHPPLWLVQPRVLAPGGPPGCACGPWCVRAGAVRGVAPPGSNPATQAQPPSQ